ncbi:uncharacterized protein LOC100904485 [Galendromus occidentalis]|uniref:Uncharacterized protein LOC100904485 n=1 Tax=Galendromus occidentalis TaxID=34638 RepID=A0AAJ6W0C2_9ACAR|nr:uncharacterized protein LOC100904485 [Galendromus occidentalis]
MTSASRSIVSQRGAPKKIHDGHVYIREKTSKDGFTQFWRCERVGACKARLHTCVSTGDVVKLIGIHSDEPNPAGIDIASRLCTLKRRALDNQETPPQLIESVFESSSQATGLVAPKTETLARVVNRTRKASRRPPLLPSSRASIIISPEYTVYESSPGHFESFLLGDSGEGDADRILWFGRQSVSEWIGLVSEVYQDGTFSLSPLLFYQILAVLADRDGFVLPVCYALLPNKTEHTYRRMLGMLRDTWPSLNASAISSDFKKGLLNAFVGAFPAAEMHGCFFHLVQNLKKMLGGMHLMGRYRNDADFNLAARMITGLAFVPPECLDNVIEDLAVHLPQELMPVLKYFEDAYVGSLLHILPDGREVRREPSFAVEMWSVYQRTLNDDSRTNNYAEAAHKRLQTEFGVDHPTLWKLIDGLRRVQHHRDLRYARLVGGHSPEPERRKYVEADISLRRVVDSFHSRTSVEFLQGVSKNYEMNA